MTTASQYEMAGVRARPELSWALGTLLDRIEGEAPKDDGLDPVYRMSPAEVDAMLGMHRAFAATDREEASPSNEGPVAPEGSDRNEPEEAPVAEAPVDVAPVAGLSTDHGTVSADEIDHLRNGSVFEPSVSRRTLVASILLPTIAAAVVATTAMWWQGRHADGDARPDTPNSAVVADSSMPSETPSSSPAAVAQGGNVAPAPSHSVRRPPAERTDAEIASEVAAALVNSGVMPAHIAVSAGSVVVDAVAPVDLLADGYFARLEELQQSANVEGAVDVEIRLELRGNAALLRDELDQLMAEHPILFDSGSTDLDEADADVLDQVAATVAAQPGLPVVIAGTTDTSGSVATNERLAQARATSVAAELIARGVPANRLQVVSYGELFGQADAAARTIRFEVGS